LKTDVALFPEYAQEAYEAALGPKEFIWSPTCDLPSGLEAVPTEPDALTSLDRDGYGCRRGGLALGGGTHYSEPNGSV
jgi:hypothetical protein